MWIFYSCDNCGEAIDGIEVDCLDEARFGFDCLTAEERRELVRLDPATGAVFVRSLCDRCIEATGIADWAAPPGGGRVH